MHYRTYPKSLLPTLGFFFLLLTACGPDNSGLRDVDLGGTAPNTGFTAVERDSTTDVLLDSHQDLDVKLSFRAAEGATAELVFQGQHVLELPSVRIPGAAPRLDVSASPGSWHDLEVVFTAAANDQPALFSAVYLDGTLLYYQLPIEGSTEEAGPLSFRVTGGRVDITEVSYTNSSGKPSYVNEDGEAILNIPQLRYEYYHLPTGTMDWRKFDETEPTSTGYVGGFDLNSIRDRGMNYAIRFTGNFDVPVAGDYEFSTYGPGFHRMYIDGEEIFDKSSLPRQFDVKASKQLTAGNHVMTLEYIQNNGWNKLNVYARAPGAAQRRFLNTVDPDKNVATVSAANPTELKTDDRPYLLRGFTYFPTPKPYEEAGKRTHALSVGEGQGPHYTVDLKTGALLQLWRGRFLDVHEMWDGRGHPQVMQPLGPTVSFDGSPQFLVLGDAERAWPDSLRALDQLRHRRYELDAKGRPTFHYELNGNELTDAIEPTAEGIRRRLVHTGGSDEVYVLLASGREISELVPGTFELRGPGVKLVVENADGSPATSAGLVRQSAAGHQRLLMALEPGASVQYALQW